MIRRPSFDRASFVRGSAEASSSAAGLWMISLADLVSLMLAFFVLMFAMREPEPRRWADMRGLVTAPSTDDRPAAPQAGDAQPTADFNVAMTEEISARNLDYLTAVLRNQLAARPSLAGLTATREDDRLTIFVPAALLFDGDGPMLSERGREALHLLAPVLARAGNRVEIVGRAAAETSPNQPAQARGGPADVGLADVGPADGGRGWERALTRAVLTAQGLRQAGYQTDLVARGVIADISVKGVNGVELTIREERAGRR